MPCKTAAGLRQVSVTSATAGRLLNHRRANNEPGLDNIRDNIQAQDLIRREAQRNVELSCALDNGYRFKHNFGLVLKVKS